MSYLNYNQKSTFKKFLLSTAVVSSVVCSSSAGFAMENDENEGRGVTYPQKQINTEQKDKDPLNNEDDRYELLEALRTVESETCESIAKFDSVDDTRVMLLGTTGAGKSTLIHQLVGCNVYADYPQNEKKLKLFVKPEDQLGDAFAVGHSKTSCTTHPSAHHDEKNNFIWWDCPGFLDSKGIMQEFPNQLAVSKLFTGEKPSKILLVANEAKFRDRRSAPVWEAVESIVTMFKKPNGSDDEQILKDLKNNLVFVVTDAPDGFDIERELTVLVADPPRKTSQITRKLMKYLSENSSNSSNSNPKCFTSFQPSMAGPFELGARNGILKALGILKDLEPSGTNLVARQASVGSYEQCAEALINDIKDDIRLRLKGYMNSLKITIDTSLSELRGFEEFFNNVNRISEKVKDDSEFLNILRKEYTSFPALKEVILDITKIADIHPFLMKFKPLPLEIGEIWTTSSSITLFNIRSQIKYNELMDKNKEATKKHEEDLEKQKQEYAEQLAEKARLTELLKSENEAERLAAQKAKENLELAMDAAKKENDEKQARYESGLKERELEREKFERIIEERAKNEKELYEKKLDKKNKKLEKIKAKGAFQHFGKGLDVIVENTGGIVVDVLKKKLNDLNYFKDKS